MKKLLITALLVLSSSPSFAQAGLPLMDPSGNVDHVSLAKTSGALGVLALQCGHYSEATLLSKKQEQQSIAVASGVSAADFDKAYQEGIQAGTSKWSQMDPSKQQKACLQAKMLISMSK